MMSAAVTQQLLVLRIRPQRRVRACRRVALHERHHGDAGLEPGEAERQLREQSSSATPSMPAGCRAAWKSAAFQLAQQLRMGAADLAEPDAEHDDVQQQVDRHDADRQADRLAEALQEDRRRARRASSSVSSTGWCSQLSGTNGFSMMCAVASAADSVMVMMKSVNAKPSRHQHERLAPPARQQLLEHQDAALAVRAVLGHLRVDRQRDEQRDQDRARTWRSATAAPAARNAMPGWYPSVEK